jgi:hypothetical protein
VPAVSPRASERFHPKDEESDHMLGITRQRAYRLIEAGDVDLEELRK